MKFSCVYKGIGLLLIIVYSLIVRLDASYNYIKQTNGCVDNKYIFLKLVQISLDQCIVECFRRPGCLAANFRRRFTLCGLVNNNNLSELEWSTSDEDCVFVNKSDMHLTIPQPFATCDVGETLDLETGTCTKTECPKLSVGNGTVLGNMNGIGNRAKYTCNPGFKREPDDPYTICQPNGTWSITPKCVKESCEDGWLLFNDSCYLFGTVNVNFNGAISECNSHGAYVVHMNDETENTFIKDHLALSGTSEYEGSFWTGLQDVVKSNSYRTWKWQDTNTETTFYDWSQGEGTLASYTENCVILHKGSNTYGWHDVSCSSLFRSLCEKARI